MNKQGGFTLIELLAVIVILAIIAVIAVPIVLNIIDETKNNAELRSPGFYLDAVEYTISDAYLNHGGLTDGEYPITPEGNLCKTALPCSEENTLKVEVNGETPTSGKIVITNGNISSIELNYKDGKTIVKNFKGELIYRVKLNDVCILQEGSTANQVGAKYECDFGDGKRNFYILELGSNPVEGSLLKDDEVALILEGNYDTTTQAWCASGNDNSCNADGLTSKLDDIAEVWKELEREQIVLPSALQIIVANIPSKNTVEYTTGIQPWLYNWDNSEWGNTVYGYWTSTPIAGLPYGAWSVDSSGSVYGSLVGDVDDGYGVRPVVNLKI